MISITVRRACPRCGGPTYLERDEYGPYVGCLACGWVKDLVPLKARPAAPCQDGEGEEAARPGKSHLKEEAIRRRQQGEPEKSVAATLGVSVRQINYWCQDIGGVKKKGCQRFRRQLKCANTCLPCLSDSLTADNSRTDVLI